MPPASDRNFITIILVPHSSRPARSWRVNGLLAVGLSLVSLVILAYLLLHVWRMGTINEGLRRQVSHLAQYEEICRRQERELQTLKEQATVLQRQLFKLEELQQQTRSILEGGEPRASLVEEPPSPRPTSGTGGRSEGAYAAAAQARGALLGRGSLPSRSGAVVPRPDGGSTTGLSTAASATDFQAEAAQLGQELQLGLQRAEHAAKGLRALNAALSLRRRFLDEIPLGWPVRGRITSGFGPRRSPVNGRREIHPAVDIAGEHGAPVAVTGRGTVVAAAWRPALGRTVIVDHGYGHRTLYGHLQRILVRPGDTVGDGAFIGTVGSTGLSTGPHLHYEVQVNGRQVDPLPYILWSPGATLPPLADAVLQELLSTAAETG